MTGVVNSMGEIDRVYSEIDDTVKYGQFQLIHSEFKMSPLQRLED